MKRILVRSGKSPFEALGIEESLARDVLSTNAGNLIFSDATHKLLTVPGTEVVSNGTATQAGMAERINDEYDAFVIPLANAFRPNFEKSLDRLTREIRKLKVPAVVVGVGAQMSDGLDPASLAGIERSVRAFCGAVLDHSATIGVRGEVTADYLTGLGFKDVEVIGCPSLFMWGPDLQIEKRVPALDEDSRISVNGAHSAVRSLGLGQIIDRTYERYPHTRFVGQNTVEARQLHWRDTSSSIGTLTTIPTHPDHPMYRAGQVRVFVDPHTWIQDLTGYDFSFGSRIHGNIAALLARIPATVLCGDSRTLELCRYHDIPHQLLRETPPDTDPAQLYAAADFGAFNAGHQGRFEHFVSFLDRNGLQNTFSHGDAGAAFEARLASLRLPAGVAPWTEMDLDAVSSRLGWLQQSNLALRSDNYWLRRDVAALKKKAATKAAPKTPASTTHTAPSSAAAPPAAPARATPRVVARLRRRLRKLRAR